MFFKLKSHVASMFRTKRVSWCDPRVSWCDPRVFLLFPGVFLVFPGVFLARTNGSRGTELCVMVCVKFCRAGMRIA